LADNYVTLYEKKTGKSILAYPCSLQEFMDSGNYTQDPPGDKKTIPQNFVESKRPTAGREGDRLAALNEFKATVDKEPEAAETTPEPEKKDEGPPRKAPRRRAS